MSGSGEKKRKRDASGKYCKKDERKDNATEDDEEEEQPMLKRDSVQGSDPGCSGSMVTPHRSIAELQREMRNSVMNPTQEQIAGWIKDSH